MKKKIIIFLFLAMLLPTNTEAVFTGAIDYSYNFFLLDESGDKEKNKKSTTTSFQQAYNLNNNGLLYNRNIGNYNISFGYINSKSNSAEKTQPNSPGETYLRTSNSSDNYSYNFSSGFFPGSVTPITLQFSRYESQLDNMLNPSIRGTSFLTKTKTTNYSATWRLISRRKLPTMTSSFNTTETNSENDFFFKDDIRRRFKLDFTKGGNRTMYRLNYNFEYFKDIDKTKLDSSTESHGVNFNFNHQLSRKMTFNGGGSYNITELSKNFNLSASLARRHSRRLTSNYTYNFLRRDADNIDSELKNSNRLSARVRYIPTAKLSTNGNTSYVKDGKNKNYNLSLGSTYKITERWHTGMSSFLNLGNIKEKNIYNHSDTVSTNYSKPFKHVQVNSSYAFTFSWRKSDWEGKIDTPVSNPSSGMSVTPDSIDFGVVSPGGESSQNISILIENGNFKIKKISIDPSGHFKAELDQTLLCKEDVVIPQNNTCIIKVTFVPQASSFGSNNANLNIESNLGTLIVPLFGKTSKHASGTSTTNSISINFASRTLKAVNLSTGLRFSKSNSKSKEENSGTEGFSTSVGMSSSYFRYVAINSSFGYTNLLSTGKRTQTINTGLSLNISVIKSLVLSLDYNFSKTLPSEGDNTETHSFSISSSAPFIYAKRITKHLTFRLAARYNVHLVKQSNTTTQVITIGPKLDYSIGKLTLSLDYSLNNTIITNNPDTKYTSIFLRATRRF